MNQTQLSRGQKKRKTQRPPSLIEVLGAMIGQAFMFACFLGVLVGIHDQLEMHADLSRQVRQTEQEYLALRQEVTDLKFKEAFLRTKRGKEMVSRFHGYLAPGERSLRSVGLKVSEQDILKFLPGQPRVTSQESRVKSP